MTVNLFAQVGIGTSNPEPSTILELKSEDKALLLTRVANTSAIPTPINGMLIYDMSANCIKGYENGAWTQCLYNSSSSSGQGLWEMEKDLIENTYTLNGVITNNYVAPVHAFVPQGVVGVYTGHVSGTGTWLIKAGPEAIQGATYNGGGTLIFTGSTSNSQTTVESGANVQLGFDVNGLVGQIEGTGFLTINAGANVNAVGANVEPGRRVIGNLENNGNLTFEGPDVCGQGYFFNAGNWYNAGTVTVKDNAYFRYYNGALFGPQVGTIRVENGGTFDQNSTNFPSTQTFALNGCGKCDANGIEQGALNFGGTNTIASPIILESNSCIKTYGLGLTTFSGQISGNYKLTLDNETGSFSRYGTTAFTSNTAPFFDNTLEVKNTSLYGTAANALSKADIVFVQNGGLQNDGGAINLGSLASDSTTSFLLLNMNGSITLKENGSTTFAGQLQNSSGTPWNFTIEGPDTNVIKLTHPTGSGVGVNLISSLGGRMIVENGTYNQWSGVGTISAGNSIATASTSRINTLFIAATSALDVYASGATTGMLYAQNFQLSPGWKVNLMEPLPAGTHRILLKPNTVALTLPTLGTNLSGRTVTGFSNNGVYLEVTLL